MGSCCLFGFPQSIPIVGRVLGGNSSRTFLEVVPASNPTRSFLPEPGVDLLGHQISFLKFPFLLHSFLSFDIPLYFFLSSTLDSTVRVVSLVFT